MKYQYICKVLFILLVLNTSSCSLPLDRVFSFYGLAFTEPHKTEIIGIWMPDESTRVKYNLDISTKLIFSADGSFKAENVPHWWKGESIGISNKGIWNLKKSNCCWSIELKFTNLLTNFLTGIGLLEHRFNGDPKYLIEITLGDPDSGNSMIFVKQKFASAIISK